MLTNHEIRQQIKRDLQTLTNMICEGYCEPPKVGLVKKFPVEDDGSVSIGCWLYSDGRILLERSPRGYGALLHELAHHFQYRVITPPKSRKRKEHGHDGIFGAAYSLVLNRTRHLLKVEGEIWSDHQCLIQKVVGDLDTPRIAEIVRNNKRPSNKEPLLQDGWDWALWRIHYTCELNAQECMKLAGHHSETELQEEPERLRLLEEEKERLRLEEEEKERLRLEMLERRIQKRERIINMITHSSPYVFFIGIVALKIFA